jgi:Flp pilus assembly protein TadD
VNLGNAMVSKNQFDDAIDYYRSALRVEPGSPLIHFDLSVALAKRGDTSEAEQERSEAMRLRAALSPSR